MNAGELAPASKSEGMLTHVDRDLELDLIREFAAGGALLRGLSFDDRRERIRVAIYTNKLAHMLFRDGPMTYAEAYPKYLGGRSRRAAPSGSSQSRSPRLGGISAKVVR
jgi:hypothetical protein